MIYEPINLYPSRYVGDGNDIIDVTVDNTFSAELRCTHAITAYRIVIMKNNAMSDIVYNPSIGPIPVSPEYHYKDSNGNAIPFEITVPATTNENFYNGYSDGYKWKLYLWESDVPDAENPDYVSADYLFYAKAESTVSVAASSSLAPLASRHAVFSADYTSTDVVRWFKWDLALVDTSGGSAVYNEVYSTGKIYSTQAEFTYSTFIAGLTYAVRVSICNQAGELTSTSWGDTTFDVTYDTISITGLTTVEQTASGVHVVWSAALYIAGQALLKLDDTPSDNYSVANSEDIPTAKTLTIGDDTYVKFCSNEAFDLMLDDENVTVLSTTIEAYDGDYVTLLEMESDVNTDGVYKRLEHHGYRNGYSGGHFVYKTNGNTTNRFLTADGMQFKVPDYEGASAYGSFLVYGSTYVWPTINPTGSVYNVVLTNRTIYCVKVS